MDVSSGRDAREPDILVIPGVAHASALAARVLVEELARRTSLTVGFGGSVPQPLRGITIAVGTRDELRALALDLPLPAPVTRAGRPAPEGYVICRRREGRAWLVAVAGNDGLGTLFGVGRLLRESHIRADELELPTRSPLISAPYHPIRGMQLGYRPLSNTYDQWSVEQFERYIRELALWGCNAIELIPRRLPPEGPDDAEAVDEWEMNLRLCELVHSYGMQVWLWLPVDDGDPSDPEQRAAVLDRRRRLFSEMAHVDHLFVPGGDPGDAPPELLLDLMAEMAGLLREHHPHAGVWVSHQGFEFPQRDLFYRMLRQMVSEGQTWLTGVVHGPGTRDSLPGTRAAVPPELQVRLYPDITHSCRCMYPVDRWDYAFALIEDREFCNPRPHQFSVIFGQIAPHSAGAIGYSDGAHDDVNKIIWLALGWAPETDVHRCMLEYGRLLVDPDLEDEVADALLGLEANWMGPVATNTTIPSTFGLWRRLHAEQPENWRVTMHYTRALCDLYIQGKLARDVAAEARALKALAGASPETLDEAVKAAGEVLQRPLSRDLAKTRDELWALARALRETIGMQLSIELGGQHERGNVMDYLDEPLNDRAWIMAQLDALPDDAAGQAAAIARIVGWDDPGPGGFYDDLGNVGREPHLVRTVPWEDDPGTLRRPWDDFRIAPNTEGWRLSWRRYVTAIYNTPIVMRYDGLDPGAGYRVRVTYTGRFAPGTALYARGRSNASGSEANGAQAVQIHGPLHDIQPPDPREFDIPCEVTAGGNLELIWRRYDQRTRGAQVAEVWLLKVADEGS